QTPNPKPQTPNPKPQTPGFGKSCRWIVNINFFQMSNILGMWIALGKRQTGIPLETSFAWPDLEIACPIPQKRVKEISIGVGNIEETAATELLCEESTQASTDSSGLTSRIEQLKMLFLELCIEDQLDLNLYRSLDAEQKEIVD